MGALRKPATVSAQRQALADALAARDTERARLAAVNAAAATSAESRWSLQQRVDDLRARLAEIKSGAVEEAIRAAAEGRKVEAPSLRDAMLDLADAEAALEVADATRERLLEQAEQGSTGAADQRVRAAAMAVLRAEAREHATALADELVRLHADVFLRVREADWLIKQRVLPVVEEAGSYFGYAADKRLRDAVMVLSSVSFSADRRSKPTDPDGAAPWRAALAALETDATAALPIEGV